MDGVDVELTGAEFDILRALAERAGRVVSRERLMATDSLRVNTPIISNCRRTAVP